MARRLPLIIPVLRGVATLVFSLVHLIPGNPRRRYSESPHRRGPWRICGRGLVSTVRSVKRYARFLQGALHGR